MSTDSLGMLGFNAVGWCLNSSDCHVDTTKKEKATGTLL